jgi:hypothetical protein
MKSVLIIKPKLWVVAKKEVDTIEFALQDVNDVVWATYDWKNSKVEVEYEDEEGEFDTGDLARAIQNTGKFQVVSVG